MKRASRFHRAQSRRRDRELAASSRRRAPPVAEDAGSLSARRAAISCFLAGHLNGAPSLGALAALKPADVRAFMAARRADNIGSRSLMRALAGMRAFARFLERSGKGKVGALAAVRAPKIPKTLPRPLSIAAAKEIADPDVAAGDGRAPWIHARDAAVLGFALWLRPAHCRSARAQTRRFRRRRRRRHYRDGKRPQRAHGAADRAGGKTRSPPTSRCARTICLDTRPAVRRRQGRPAVRRA